MITVDTVGIVISMVGLLGVLIVFLKFVSERPTRTEMKQEIKDSINAVQKSVDEIKRDFKTEIGKLGEKIDKIVDHRMKRR